MRRQYEIKEHELENAHYNGALKIAREFFGEEYEKKISDHNKMHDIAASKLSERFMQLELDYLNLTDEWKKTHPNMVWHPSGVKGFFTRAFWHNMQVRAKSLGLLNWPEYGEVTIK